MLTESIASETVQDETGELFAVALRLEGQLAAAADSLRQSDFVPL